MMIEWAHRRIGEVPSLEAIGRMTNAGCRQAAGTISPSVV
jgi:hypothetical protein